MEIGIAFCLPGRIRSLEVTGAGLQHGSLRSSRIEGSAEYVHRYMRTITFDENSFHSPPCSSFQAEALTRLNGGSTGKDERDGSGRMESVDTMAIAVPGACASSGTDCEFQPQRVIPALTEPSNSFSKSFALSRSLAGCAGGGKKSLVSELCVKPVIRQPLALQNPSKALWWAPSPIPTSALPVPIKNKAPICSANDWYIIRKSLSCH